MLAGGVGNIRAADAHKADVPPGALLIQLGGPGILIGLGGGSASSMSTGANTADLYFHSVQRGNAEIQRRAQEVIDACWAQGPGNPILPIHDVGAGGLSNALPELVHGAGRGARIDLRAAPNEEPGMTAGLVPTRQLTEIINPLSNADRPAVDSVSRGVLPDAGMSFEIPRITAVPTVAEEAEAATIDETDMTNNFLSVSVKKYAGGQTFSVEQLPDQLLVHL